MYIFIYDILNIKNLIMKRKYFVFAYCSIFVFFLTLSTAFCLISKFWIGSMFIPSFPLTLLSAFVLIIAFWIVCFNGIDFLYHFITDYKGFRKDKELVFLRENYVTSKSLYISISWIISILLMVISTITYVNKLESCGISLDDKPKVKFMSELSFKERGELFLKCSAKNENREKVAEVMKKYCAIDDRMYDLENPLSIFTKSCIEEINQDISNAILIKSDENQLNMLLKKKESLIQDLKQFNL